MKYMIAGFGSIGRRHMQNLQALGETDILLYRTHKSTLVDDEIADIPVETDLNAALAHKPDAVIIANPTALHMDVAIPAAKAGCHIFLEKPIAHNLERIDELKAALKEGGGQVFVGYQFRFHPGLKKVAAFLRDGVIGNTLSVRVQWGEFLPGWHPWEDYRKSYSARADLGGGVVLTLCHPLDYMRWLFGDVESLWAFSSHISDLEIDVEDVAEIGMRFTQGVLGSVHLNYFQQPGVHHMEILGTGGTIRWDNNDGAVRLYRSSAKEWEVFPAPDGFERNDLFLDEMRHFIQVVKGETTSSCSLTDGMRVIQMTDAIYDSAKQGQQVQLL